MYECMYVNKITFGYLPRFRTCRQFRFPDWSAPPNTQMLWGVQEGMKLACSYRGKRPSEVAKSHRCAPRKHFTQFLDWGCQLLRLPGNSGEGSEEKRVKSISEQPSDHLNGMWSNSKKFYSRHSGDYLPSPWNLFCGNYPPSSNHRKTCLYYTPWLSRSSWLSQM